jgi:hypothetical protein
MVSMLLGLLGLSTRKDSRADHTRPICPRRETSFVDAHVEREKRRGERARQHGFQISTEPLFEFLLVVVSIVRDSSEQRGSAFGPLS